MYKLLMLIASTFSIIAFDPATQELGAAVATFPANVGALVLWAKADVGAIATQGLTNPGFGPRGLELLSSGKNPEQVADELLKDDPQKEQRQLAIIDSKGNAFCFTGKECFQFAGQIAAKNYSIQGNLLKNDKTLAAMQNAFLKNEGNLAERLIRTLEAAQKTGGDSRGHKSAALLVVRKEAMGFKGFDRLYDIRVDLHEDPVNELRRIYQISRQERPR